MSDKVTINVGGKEFVTTRSTLEKSPYFRSLLEWREIQNVTTEIFVDRDPDNFRHVLALLRDPQHCFPEELEYELVYYQLCNPTVEETPVTVDPFDGHLRKEDVLKSLSRLSFGAYMVREHERSYDDYSKKVIKTYDAEFIDTLIVINAERVNKRESVFTSGNTWDMLLYIVYDYTVPENCSMAEIISDSGSYRRILNNHTVFHPVVGGLKIIFTSTSEQEEPPSKGKRFSRNTCV
jgi:hypothetical protein